MLRQGGGRASSQDRNELSQKELDIERNGIVTGRHRLSDIAASPKGSYIIRAVPDSKRERRERRINPLTTTRMPFNVSLSQEPLPNSVAF